MTGAHATEAYGWVGNQFLPLALAVCAVLYCASCNTAWFFQQLSTCRKKYGSKSNIPSQRTEQPTEYPVDDFTVLLDLMQPAFDIGKTLSIGDIVHHYYPMCASVVPVAKQSIV
ncbi:hypothetical protein E2C01_024320 [Portunus trituberculatus]|uniref:Uncharacterized protein n=1 Tax=Portunus trituberculatus TaxID=210409 RepID=A0A5B7EE93_PORTR|nr:hypothetical protein [Portunus trituberculatus]